MKSHFTLLPSPVGELLLTTDGKALTGLYFENDDVSRAQASRADDHPIFKNTAKQLKEYFTGKRTEFDVPLNPTGTEFQLSVWRALSDIPYGQTISYGEQAKRIVKPTGSRAVGTANGRNPISIIVPCHRVIGANGSLTGYGGGLERKEMLLALESKQSALPLQ